jgi:hypothetical protein
MSAGQALPTQDDHTNTMENPMRTLTVIPNHQQTNTPPIGVLRPRARAGGRTPDKPSPLSRVRHAAAEIAPETIERIAQRVVQLLRHEPDPIDDGPSKPPELMDAEQLARRFGLTRAWVYENAGKLGAIPLSDGPRPRLRFDPEVAAQALRNRRRRNEPVPVTDMPRPRPTRRRRTPATVPLLPIHEPRSRGVFARWRPAYRSGR